MSFDSARNAILSPTSPFGSLTPAPSTWTADPWNGETQTPSVIPESAVPALYEKIFQASEPSGSSITLSSLNRVLAAGSIPSSVQEKIITLVVPPSSSRVPRDSLFVALCLLAFAQTSLPLSIQSVAASASASSLPLPLLPPSFSSPPALSTPGSTITSPRVRPARSNSEGSIDPWNTGARSAGAGMDYGRTSASLGYAIRENGEEEEEEDVGNAFGTGFEDSTSGGMGYGNEGWALKKQEQIVVLQSDQLGGWVLKHVVWIVRRHSMGSNVERRYSDFVWLLDCLTRRYPFRMLPALPPKRIAIGANYLAADDFFLERRRRGLQRFLTFIINHPSLKKDALVHTFLTEQTVRRPLPSPLLPTHLSTTQDLSLWRQSALYTLEEESLTRTLTPSEEMSIPEDLESKLTSLRSRIGPLVEHWTRIVSTYDRISHRREAQGADLTRLKLALKVALESERAGWRIGEIEAVENEMEVWAESLGVQGEIVAKAGGKAIDTTVEELKRQRELYVSFRELLSRQITLSPDAVDRLKKRVDVNLKKLETIRETKKENYETEVEKLTNVIESDQRSIEALIRRRVFIRFSIWQEMVLVLFRSSSLLSVTFREYAADEAVFAERVRANAVLLSENLA